MPYKPATKGYYRYIRELAAKNPGADMGTLQRLAGLGDYAMSKGVSLDMYENPGQMLEDLQEKLKSEPQPQRPPQPQAQPPIPGQQFHFGGQASYGGSPNMLNPMGQFALGNQMINDVTGAIRDENDSRVAQEREFRRQEHEKQLMKMQLEAQKRSDDAALIRSLLGGM